MLCKKCKKELQEDWLYCPWCGAAQKRDRKKTMYQRPDGLYSKQVTINGKRKSFYGKSEAEIFKRIAEYNAEEEESLSAKQFKYYAEQLERSWDSLSPNSLKGYKPALRRCVDQFGEEPITSITPMMVKTFLDKLGMTLSKKTVMTHRNMISQVFDIAILSNDLQYNPVSVKYKTPGAPSKRREEATAEDRQKIAQFWDESIYSRLGYLIMMTGLRKGEALALQYKDIDREKKTISVSKSVYFIGTAPKIKAPKTQAGMRTVVLLPDVEDRFNGEPEQFLFTSDGENMLKSHEVDHGWKRFCENHKISATFHQLRHSFATTCRNAGIDPKVVQEMMGHSSYIVTDGYTHVRDEMLKKARESLKESM